MANINWSKFRISFNSPAVLGFTALCACSYILGILTGGASNRLLFSVYRSPLLSPFTWLRFVTHVFGHSSWDHLIGNLMLLLILGPMLEEKYGSKALLVVMLTAALVTGVLHFVLFPGTRLMGASGVVFAFILLSSFTGDNNGAIPLTFILVAVLYAGQQLHQAFTGAGSISYLAHLAGGLVGAFFGFIAGGISLR
ncbi:MAG: rhomboid family intramembrane serine protease [Clostridia bacterium]|nr:rhomboid family intramembrane serine protease [Clostridia bacterium]